MSAEGIKITAGALKNGRLLTFTGTLDVHSQLEEIFSKLTGLNVFDLAGVRQIDSTGMRQWINAIERLRPDAQIVYANCSVAMVQQFNMVMNARGPGRILSFHAPYFCEECDDSRNVLLKASDLAGPPFEPPEAKCPDCSSELDFDDVADRYFLFLEAQSAGKS